MSKRIDYDQATIDAIFRRYRKDFETALNKSVKRWGTDGVLNADDMYESLTRKEMAAYKKKIRGWLKSGKYDADKQFIRTLERNLGMHTVKRIQALELDIRKVTSTVKFSQELPMLKSLYQTYLDSEKAVARILNKSFTMSGDDVIYKSIAKTFHGHSLMYRFWHQASDMAFRFMNLIKNALKNGTTISGLRPIVKYYFSSGDYRARTLLVTESARINSEGKLSGFEKAGVKYYQYMAIMDSRTTDICIHHDLKVYRVSKMNIGVNAPPLHPNCRSSIQAYFIDDRSE